MLFITAYHNAVTEFFTSVRVRRENIYHQPLSLPFALPVLYGVECGNIHTMLYTADSPILGTYNATADQALRYVLARSDAAARRTNGYTDASVKEIVGLYWSIAVPVGVDPVICFSQMCHETGGLRSYWSARPRRNGCGYGKTGHATTSDPHDSRRWFEVRPCYWEEGCVFPDWQMSIQAQVGRLLAYALPPEQLTPAQQTLVRIAADWRHITPPIYASAPTLKPLGAIHNPRNAGLPIEKWIAGWAWSGADYGKRIAVIANAVVAQH